MKKSRKLLMILGIVLSLAIATGSTLAYLTDTDSDVNVMTLGNVDIEQIEQEWNEDQTELKDFTQEKPLYPYVGELGWENKEEADGAYRRFTMENVVDKYVTVENTGKSDAYVRTFFAFEMGDYSYEEFKMVGISNNSITGAEFPFPGTWEWNLSVAAVQSSTQSCGFGNADDFAHDLLTGQRDFGRKLSLGDLLLCVCGIPCRIGLDLAFGAQIQPLLFP